MFDYKGTVAHSLVVISLLFFASIAQAANDYIVAPSGGDITGAALSTQLATASVTLKSSEGANSGSGNVIINDVVEWTANTTLTLTASNNVSIKGSIAASGATAGMIISPNTANSTGANSEQPSGKGIYSLSSSITLSGSTPSLNISGVNYLIINSLGKSADATTIPAKSTLQSMAALDSLGQPFALGSDIDASATATWNGGQGFTPIGKTATGYFSGTLDGLGHNISNLTIIQPPSPHYCDGGSSVGLFANLASGGVVKNVGLINANIQGSTTGCNSVSGLVASNMGTIVNSFVTGQIIGNSTRGGDLTGGFSAQNWGTIDSCFFIGVVSDNGANVVGGFVGANKGTIRSSFVNADVTESASTVGVLVGTNSGTIDSTYAFGSITDTWRDQYGWSNGAGGLVGFNCNANQNRSYCSTTLEGKIYNSYAAVTSNGAAGIAGGNDGLVSTSYWNNSFAEIGVIPGRGTTSGVSALSTSEMQEANNFIGFDFSTPVWVIIDENGTLNNLENATGATFPILASEYSTRIVSGHRLQLMLMNKAASYTLEADIDLSNTKGTGDVWPETGFIPIGSYAEKFIGDLDGQGNSIKNLYINHEKTNRVGLFGYVSSSASIKNTKLEGGTIKGNNGGAIGSLAGINDGTVYNCSSSASVEGSRGGIVGGLIGSNNGTISSSAASGAISGIGGYRGGFVGINSGTMSSCTVTSTVSGKWGVSGSVVAENFGTNDCSS